MFERYAPYRALAASLQRGLRTKRAKKPGGLFFLGSGETGPWAEIRLSRAPT